MLDQLLLAGAVALVLAVELRHGDWWLSSMTMRKSSGKKSSSVLRRLARAAAVERRRVVLDPVAVADLLHHLEVVLGAHPEALGLEELALLLELGEPLLELLLDALDGLPHPLVAGDVVGGRVDDELVEHGDLLAGERVDHLDALDLVAEQLDADGRLLVGRVHLDGVAPHPELARARGSCRCARSACRRASAARRAGRSPCPTWRWSMLFAVLLGRAEAVDAGHRRDHDDVAPGEQRRGGGVAQPVDLVVHRRVLLDVGVARGDVRLGLVVVVVGDEVLDPVVGEELPELVGELGGRATCWAPARAWAAAPARSSRRWWRSCPEPVMPEERLVAVAPLDALGQRGDRPSAGRPPARSRTPSGRGAPARCYRRLLTSPVSVRARSAGRSAAGCEVDRPERQQLLPPQGRGVDQLGSSDAWQGHRALPRR